MTKKRQITMYGIMPGGSGPKTVRCLLAAKGAGKPKLVGSACVALFHSQKVARYYWRTSLNSWPGSRVVTVLVELA